MSVWRRSSFNRPCTNKSLFIQWKEGSPISQLLYACNPSFPLIPIPISPSRIIPISFAPSPIHRTWTTAFFYTMIQLDSRKEHTCFLTSFSRSVMSCFWSFRIRAMITEGALQRLCMKQARRTSNTLSSPFSEGRRDAKPSGLDEEWDGIGDLDFMNIRSTRCSSIRIGSEQPCEM